MHDDVLPAPFEAALLTGLKIAVAADNENAVIVDGPLAEPCFVFIAVPSIFELVEPVDQLAIAVVEARRPLARRFLSLADEETFRPGVLEFDEAVALAHRIADDQVAREVAEQVVFPGQQVEPCDGLVEESCQRRKVSPCLEERSDIALFLEHVHPRQEGLEFHHLLATTVEAQPVCDERLHDVFPDGLAARRSTHSCGKRSRTSMTPSSVGRMRARQLSSTGMT